VREKISMIKRGNKKSLRSAVIEEYLLEILPYKFVGTIIIKLLIIKLIIKLFLHELST